MSANAREFSENSPVQMAEVIAGFLQGRNVVDIAETTGIPRGRIIRWYRSSEQFRKMLEETSDEVVNKIRAEISAETADRLAELLPEAVDVLQDALSSDKMSERMTAAAHVMRFAGLGAKQTSPTGPSAESLIRGTGGPAAGD